MTLREIAVLEMMRGGGSFVSALAKAWVRADAVNFHKLKVAFPEYWDEYEDLVQKREDRRAKEHGE